MSLTVDPVHDPDGAAAFLPRVPRAHFVYLFRTKAQQKEDPEYHDKTEQQQHRNDDHFLLVNTDLCRNADTQKSVCITEYYYYINYYYINYYYNSLHSVSPDAHNVYS